MNARRIGILTSGGDCSGLNSVIRAAFVRGAALGYELLGIKRGLCGLAISPYEHIVMNEQICCDEMLSRAGSIICSDTNLLSTMKRAGKTTADAKEMVAEGYKRLSLSGLICVGGDGSLRIISELCPPHGDVKVVMIPKTIDNDVSNTDFSVGFQTSVEVATAAIENAASTARSHSRVMVVEVMGRDAGYIALFAGLAAGADVILVPEFKYNLDTVHDKVKQCLSSCKEYCIIVVAESVEAEDFKHERSRTSGFTEYIKTTYRGIGRHIAHSLSETGIDSRCIVLGHVQRGGRTSVNDRLLGTMFGVEAVNAIDSGRYGTMLSLVNGRVKTLDFATVVKAPNKSLTKDDPHVQAAKFLDIYVGEL
ncbi:MAG: ATP-dependent 6-phosphofructokinase [Holosporales bacterium]|jgi:6-phosphofructokinase 1|nr:ATP-dependent 6-phosphofructokinase [Holosporales bacterium]